MGDVKLVECFADRLIDNIFDGFGVMVEGWNRRKDYPSHFRDRGHGSQVAQMQGRFPWNEHKLSPLFEGYIRGPDQQIVI